MSDERQMVRTGWMEHVRADGTLVARREMLIVSDGAARVRCTPLVPFTLAHGERLRWPRRWDDAFPPFVDEDTTDATP